MSVMKTALLVRLRHALPQKNGICLYCDLVVGSKDYTQAIIKSLFPTLIPKIPLGSGFLE